MEPFVHLHLHTEYSLLDGAARIKKVVEKAKEYGMPAIAMTDHGNMYGAVQFYDECKAQGVKPIIGCEFYCSDDLSVKSGKVKLAHLVLLAKDKTGYDNLCRLNTIAFRDGYYYKPRIDLKALESHHEGLVCLSACVAGDVPQLILKHEYEKAEELILWFKNLFGDDYYLELQNHFLPEQIEVNHKLREYSQKFGIKTVITNDVHYVNREDAMMQDVLMCVQMNKTYNDPNRMKFSNDEFYFKTRDELAELFPNDLHALDTTLEIADKCNFDFVYGHYMYPQYHPRTGQTSPEFMRDLCEQGIIKRYKKETPEIRERLEYELGVITKLNYIDYFLIVWDYINAAREAGISVGPGRGSGAGSIVAYLIGITSIDPLRYGLFFERFLNPERVSAPDFDIDFEDSRRAEVFEYVKKKYGDDRVVKIITFGTMAAKNAIKDVARVLQVPLSTADKITKMIPNTIRRPNIIKKVFAIDQNPDKPDESIPELVQMYNENDEVRRVVDIAWKLEDSPRQTGIHACGVIIGGDVLERHIPIARNGDILTSQYVGGELEHLGLLKMDFLGLRNLSDIKMAIEYIKENHGVTIDFDEMDYDDAGVFKLISTGNTKAIFQLESAGFQKFMKQLQPTCIEDIIAGVAMYRPGPMDSIPTFVRNKHNPELITYINPVMEPILSVTYGCIVYQEQVMKIVQDLAGYTLGRADSVRKMMGKKKFADLQKERQVFLYGLPAENGRPAIDGVLKRGVPEDVANNLWDEMEKFGSYAFNKSHAAAYSYVSYQTAYLKTYYEPEFLTAVLNNRITNADEIANYVAYAKEEGINVLPPDINKSKTYFNVDKSGDIRFGLAALKNVGVQVIDDIIAEREKNGEFKDLVDFVTRVPAPALNKRCMESLILSGAFDSFGRPRSQLMGVFSQAVERAMHYKKEKEDNQVSLFGMFEETKDVPFTLDYPDVKEYTNKVKLDYEKEVVGVYLTGHPLDEYKDRMTKMTLTSAMMKPDEVDEMDVDDEGETAEATYSNITQGEHYTAGGCLIEYRTIMTKSGRKMAVGTLEDLYGTMDVVLFMNAYERYKDTLHEGDLVTLKGMVSLRDGQSPSLSVDYVDKWDEKQNAPTQEEMVMEEEEKPKRLCLKYDTHDAGLHDKIKAILLEYPGIDDVFVRDSKTREAFQLGTKVQVRESLIFELSALLEQENIVVLDK
ncbi:MAG: DNA polymerase III subunit alpha [Clostridia bacterium]